MKLRLLLTLALSLLAVAAVSVFAVNRVVSHGAEVEAKAEACGAEEEGGGSEGERAREGKPSCESVEDMGRELQEPADALLSRDLFGSDRNVDFSKAFTAAAAQGAALGRSAKRRDPRAAKATWDFLGPASIGGRVLDVAIDPQQADTIYIATATGGVWKSTDKGTTFQPAWPDDLTQSIGALVITPSGTLWAGTGEAGPGGGSITYGGNGLYRSDDRGKSWKLVALPDSSRISRIVVDPKNENRIFVAATGPLYRAGGQRGLYRTEDGGKTWTQVLKGDNDTTGAADVAIDPRDSKTMFATTWDAIRYPDKRQYTGLGSGVYKSTDGGTTWSRIVFPGLGPDTELGRPGVTVASDGTVYVLTSGTSGAYRSVLTSTDGGTTFTPSPPDPNLVLSQYVYGWWFGRIWTDPKDPKHVWVPGVDLMESKDGARTWDVATGGAHADQHAMAWDPKVPGRVYLGNDGGLYRSDTNGGNWKAAKSMPFSQLYSMDVGEQDPARMVAGLQDNGVNRNYTSRGVDSKGQWNSYVGGDGQRALINPKDQKIVYGCYQYGDCFVSTDGGSTSTEFVNSVVSTRKNWFTPIEFDPENPHTIYTGGEIMSRSDDDANSFTPISGDLSNGPGRETNPLFKNYGTITTIAPAGLSKKTIYAGTDDGNLWYTHNQDDPTAWTKASDPDLPKAWITRVEVSHKDPNVAYVTYSGFRQDDNAAYLLKTTDGGKSWANITGNLPKAPLNDVNIVGDTLVVASDVGVFYKKPSDSGWLKLGNGLPLAPIFELRYHQPTDTLYAATFGRGIYKVNAAELH